MTGKVASPHPALQGSLVRDNRLHLGGMALDRLTDRVGVTPFYAYKRQRISERIDMLRCNLPDRLGLHYAIKANPLPTEVQHLAGLVNGFDVASVREMHTALDATMPAACISFAGPGKTRQELAQALAGGVTITIESETEMRTLAAIGVEKGIRPRVGVRVNPDFDVKASGMRMDGGAQQFGVDAERVPQLLGELSPLDLEFVGFHVFSGSQNLNAELLCDAQARTVDLVLQLAESAPGPVRHINIGGGFGIPYFPNDRPLDLARIGENLDGLLARAEGTCPDARVVVELGRYIVGESGVYVARVVDRKESRGQTFLVTDGGLHHHLAASGNFGRVIRRNYPVVIGNRTEEPASETVNIVGCLCTPLDLLADKVVLPRANIRDLVVIFQSGAYGLTASPTDFLSPPRRPSSGLSTDSCRQHEPYMRLDRAAVVRRTDRPSTF